MVNSVRKDLFIDVNFHSAVCRVEESMDILTPDEVIFVCFVLIWQVYVFLVASISKNKTWSLLTF